MHPTLRCAAIQMLKASKSQTPLRQHLSAAVIRNTNALNDGVRVDRSADSFGTVAKGCSTECGAVLADENFAIFEGNNKQAWVDLRRGYCHLCQEPVGTNVGLHVSDRDHSNLQFFFFLHTAYPRRDFIGEAARSATAGEVAASFSSGKRDAGSAQKCATAGGATTSFSGDSSLHAKHSRGSLSSSPLGGPYVTSSQRPLWHADKVLDGIRTLSPSLHRFATDHRATDALHTATDAARRAELEALIFYLTHPPHQALSHALQGRSSYSFWYSGERIWKDVITRLVTQIYPPLSAGMMTNFTQKCWGRSNEERLYDALHFQQIKSYYGWAPFEGKEKKAFFFRQILYELLMAEVRPELSETAKLLAAQTVRRIAFELVFLLSMDYMHRIQHVHQLMGCPTLSELQALNLL